MLIREEHGDKRHHLTLLLLADEQESMVDRYLDEGTMYVLEVDSIVVGECVVNDAGDGVLEIKNIAVNPSHQHQGYGRMLIDFVAKRHAGEYDILQVGTVRSPCRFTSDAASSALMWSRGSSRKTTTTPYSKAVSSSSTWFTCASACRWIHARGRRRRGEGDTVFRLVRLWDMVLGPNRISSTNKRLLGDDA